VLSKEGGGGVLTKKRGDERGLAFFAGDQAESSRPEEGGIYLGKGRWEVGGKSGTKRNGRDLRGY